jgi:hypothetical protein
LSAAVAAERRRHGTPLAGEEGLVGDERKTRKWRRVVIFEFRALTMPACGPCFRPGALFHIGWSGHH